MDISALYDEIARCNRCGFCQVACPIFRATGQEAGVARGRIGLLRALIEGRLSWSKDLEEPLFACLLCGACTANCFPAVETADLITTAREEYLDRAGRKRLHRLLFDHLLPYPGRMRLAAKVAALGTYSGLSNVIQALGLLRIFGRDFPRSEEVVGRFPKKAFRDKVKPGILEGQGDSLRIGYFVGCGTDIMVPRSAEASLRFILEMGKTVHVLANCCCGLPALTYGDRKAGRRLAEKNMELISTKALDMIVTDCSSCAGFLKKYPELFAGDQDQYHKANDLSSRVLDLVELASSMDKPFARLDQRVIVTYHDPCHASRGQGLVKEPRNILRSLPDVEYRELPEADWCCGGAGSYALSHYDLSMQVLNRKMDHVEKTGADMLVTSCPACIIQLSYGIRLRNLPVRVCHISEVISRIQGE
jgi:glycolate oxidase iron-sulfur subunit